MKIQKLTTILLVSLVSCTKVGNENSETMSDQVLYESEIYDVYADRVTQGLFEAAAISPTSMISNYQSPANERHSRGVMFKFSINGKDNELPPGSDHFMVLYPEQGGAVTPVIRFGERYVDTTAVPQDSFLEPNTRFRIRLDMSPVLEAFEKQGYYETYAGERVYKEDFKGVYVAGNAEPLSWDFENLPSREGMQLTDHDGDGIYETTLTLNQYNPENFTAKRWELQEDVSEYPQYRSEQLLLDALYNLSLEELKLDIRPDNTFMAGEQWNGVWTRDISYSILLALAAIEPEVSRNSLMRKVNRNRIIQDTGTGGSWPVSTDRTTWALAAWEVYKVTGDEEWLRQAYEIIRNSAEDDLKVAYDEETGLFLGESSFLDWRKQSYPRWMEPIDIYKSENLGTNVVHYQTYRILAQMAEILGEDGEKYQKIAEGVKEGINKYLWVEDKGYYGQYLYGNHYLALSPRAEALGESLSVLFEVGDEERREEVVENTPVVPFGVPSIFPQIPGIPPYHNNGIWPFVQAYWNWAAAKVGNEAALEQGLAALYRAAALFLTNKENMVVETGDFKGTEINSDRQLWSVAGNLAMVYRVFYGMRFEPDGIYFEPAVPESYAGERLLSNFRYRNAVLEIQLEGWGNSIHSIYLDGEPLEEPFIPADLEGNHTIAITLVNGGFEEEEFNLRENYTAPETPIAVWQEGKLQWKAIENASQYQVWVNGKEVEATEETYLSPSSLPAYAELQVAAVDENGVASFLSEPVVVTDKTEVLTFELENFAPRAGLDLAGFSGEGFVEISKQENLHIPLRIKVPEAGTYLLDFRYSNGSGPINTDNKAAIRTLLLNGEYVSTVVFPQRGTDEWSNWGWSNAVEAELKEGVNELSLVFEPFNENMNVDVNRAMLDQLRVIKLEE
ncbi:alpha-L-rhamnosidase-related protein [Nafulsella turpanensis]|uniref:alpha-L-rhamnosidase-related protein n=1 Tax=Nafulsella turpanensis TaxID=1265690 RepID=UPI000368BB3A|nr:amylo-alpha-1,6-glucosidase [Nafulsella turpanensis]